MADLTESEKKMLRELSRKYRLYSPPDRWTGEFDVSDDGMAALSELLLAMKERAAQICLHPAGHCQRNCH